MNASYLPDQYGVSFTITYNGAAIVNETLSGMLFSVSLNKVQYYKLRKKNVNTLKLKNKIANF